MFTMEQSLEIRKLPLSHILELVKILEFTESWKRLMAIIPKTLEKDNYKCDITLNNLHKYNSEHFKLIENASIKYKKTCTEILFDEWGTSGRVRPALGHLLYLLIKAELFRAADYVAIHILKQEPPRRPNRGPAALITTNLTANENDEVKRIEKILDEINYPSSAIENIKNTSINTNIDYSNVNKEKIIPEIVISESPDVVESDIPPIEVPIIVQNKSRSRENTEVSDMIQFSLSGEQNLPQITSLLSNDRNCVENLPNLSILGQDSIQNIPDLSALNLESESASNLPQLSDLLTNSNSDNNDNIPNISQLLSNTPNIPNISAFNQTTSSIDFGLNSKENNLPILSNLLNTKSTRPSCTSPLPNLSLNTRLPHFNYYELEAATNDFNENPISEEGGRFLGSGAFGTVYLAMGLLDKPVAVKKLMLDNVEVVNVDDTITKQFRTEVEILSKYQHENLLCLLGYSCDGPTYCLMYEYIPGGALKDRLQNKANKLIWTERLYIAIGTAKAISYLHTAVPTPLIHRDVKTANILLDVTNKPKLCDFGLIKLLPNQNTSTGTTVYGTSAYMAPEAFRGDISVKMDTFSFGVVLLELLTSLPPLDENREGCDLVTHVGDNCEDSISPLLDVSAGPWFANNIDFSEELFKIARKCLKEKKNRPNMVEITSQLNELVQKAE